METKFYHENGDVTGRESMLQGRDLGSIRSDVIRSRRVDKPTIQLSLNLTEERMLSQFGQRAT